MASPHNTPVPVEKKEKASLLNKVLRIFEIPQANEPIAGYLDPNYYYDSSVGKFKMVEITDANEIKKKPTPKGWLTIGDATKTAFDNLKQVTKYKYGWDAAKFEKDHFLEVQHVIKMLVQAGYLTDEKWVDVTLVSLLHLGFYVNDSRNIWNLPAGLNQIKKNISLASWYANRTSFKNKPGSVEIANAEKTFIAQYMFGYTTGDGRTPFTELVDLATEMATVPPSELTHLTIAAGQLMIEMLQTWVVAALDERHKNVIARISSIKDAKSDMPDLMNRSKEIHNEARKKLAEKAAKGETIFTSGIDKAYTGPAMQLESEHFSDTLQHTGMSDEDVVMFEEDEDYY